MNTDPKAGFPTFGAAVRSQRKRCGGGYERRSRQIRKPMPSGADAAPTINHAVSRVLADRVTRGEGTFTP